LGFSKAFCKGVLVFDPFGLPPPGLPGSKGLPLPRGLRGFRGPKHSSIEPSSFFAFLFVPSTDGKSRGTSVIVPSVIL
jgi:hypothetical protein